ncbi:TonB-dependent receptor [Sphingomicrobium clamense]|uniref:TonB-dependent receptor n=1 Tax=Sphingomicrobium clamense TaxID=2851013 RepID=A0ABS6V740_9SPHN|nr:TonB-dependent receptor [Sphingomicrobium sp. B8]
MKKLILLSSTAVFLPSAAFAQSTGSVDFEEAIVITGAANQDIDGIQIPETSKPKQILGEEVLERQSPGQTVLDATNIVPGVSFTSNDAYGGSGGEIIMRGFDDSRVSITFDGIPLNDSGNYQIYTGQTLDGELVEQVNVNLGTTDVDSPTASAVGGTVNYRMRNPEDDFGAQFVQSIGEYNFYRTFMSIDTGEIFKNTGITGLVAVSHEEYDNAYNGYGQVNRQQVNAKVHIPVSEINGDFVNISGHYNTIRNNFFGSVGLRYDRAPGGGFPQTKDEREYSLNFPCTTEVPSPGTRDGENGCGTEFERRYNPANTGNIRIGARFTLADDLVLTLDPSYQYVKANGGGTRGAEEGFNFQGFSGYLGGRPYFGGVDLNGDGDTLDRVTVLTPSQTRTHRYGLISGLRYNINDNHTVRLSYTHDYANHRQTGQVGRVRRDGEPVTVFPIDDPLFAANGNILQKRDRQSYAILNQIAGEWRGEFDALTVNVGARFPFFKRDLENYCFTTSPSGFVDCFGQNAAEEAAYAAANPDAAPPQQRILKYDDFLPNVGAVYEISNNFSVFGSYAKSISVPGTDALYDSFFFDEDSPAGQPVPETTDTFDGGVRYLSSKVQAQVNGWYTKFNNRLAVSYNVELDEYIFRNLGPVDKYGIDASVAYAPIPELTLYAFGSVYDSEIKEDVEIDAGVFAPTAGKREGGAPTHMFGGSVVTELGDFSAGLTAKYTGGRYLYDTNEPASRDRFPAKTDGYWMVNADIRYDLENLVDGLDNSFVQLNVYNLFDTLYVGSFGARLSPDDGTPFAQIGVPRTVSATLSLGF